MNLLLLEPGERLLRPGDPRLTHLRSVLRVGPGSTVKAGEVDGPVGTAAVLRFDADGLLVEFCPESPAQSVPPVEVLLGHPRPIVLRRLFRDLATIGVARVVVCPTELGERSYFDSTVWDDVPRLLREGASQGGSTVLPEVERSGSLESASRGLRAPCGSRIVLHAGSGNRELLCLLEGVPAGPIALAVGSERGWTPAEIGTLGDAGFVPADAGPRILRTETAAVVAAWAAVGRCRGAHR